MWLCGHAERATASLRMYGTARCSHSLRSWATERAGCTRIGAHLRWSPRYDTTTDSDFSCINNPAGSSSSCLKRAPHVFDIGLFMDLLRSARHFVTDRTERAGFEPAVQLNAVQRFSKPSLSAAQPPLPLVCGILRYVLPFGMTSTHPPAASLHKSNASI